MRRVLSILFGAGFTAATAWALGRIGGDLARDALERAAARETEPAVLSEIGYAQREVHESRDGGVPK